MEEKETHNNLSETETVEESERKTRVLILIGVILFFLLIGVLVAYYTSSAYEKMEKSEKNPTVSTIIEKRETSQPASLPIRTAPSDTASEAEVMDDNFDSKSSAESSETMPAFQTDETETIEAMSDESIESAPSQEAAPTMQPATTSTVVMKENSQPNIGKMIDLEVHEAMIEELKEKIRRQEITIKDLNNEIIRLRDNTTYRMAKLPTPKPVKLAECADMGTGSWQMTESCEKAIQIAIAKVENMTEHVLAWEVIPRVDFNTYGGMSPELKQEGLAAYRAYEAMFKLDLILGTDVVKFKGVTLQEEGKRGFVLKVYIMESGL